MERQQQTDELNRQLALTSGQRFWVAARVYTQARQMGEAATNFAIDQHCPGCHGGGSSRPVSPVWG